MHVWMRKLARPAALAAAMLAATALTGCGGGQSGGGSGGSATVTFMTWETPETNAAIDKATAQFMKDNPNIKVERIPSPNSDYGTKLSSLQLAKKLPDLFWCGNDTEQQFGSAGLLHDWTDLVKSGGPLERSKFAPASTVNWEVKGKLYGLPSLLNTYGVWYNESLLQQAGVAIPRPGWSWDEMYKDARALTQVGGGYGMVDGLFTVPAGGPFWMSNYSVSAGGQPFENHINNPTSVTADAKLSQGVGKLAAAVQDHSITPPGYDTSTAANTFAAGRVPMLTGGQWLAASFMQTKPSFKYGFAPLPVVQKRVQPYDAVGICAPSTIQNTDAVSKLMTYLDGKTWERVLPSSPVAPPAYLPADGPYYSTLRSAGLSSTADSVQYELETPTKEGIRFTSTWSVKANDILTAHWGDILQGKKPLSDLQVMTQQLNELIASSH